MTVIITFECVGQTDRHLFNDLFTTTALGKPAPEKLNQSGF